IGFRHGTESVDAPARQGARLRRTVKYGARSATQPGRMQRRSNAGVIMKRSTKGPSAILHPEAPVLQEVEVLVNNREVAVLLPGEQPEELLLLRVGGGLRHPVVHLAPPGLEGERLPPAAGRAAG